MLVCFVLSILLLGGCSSFSPFVSDPPSGRIFTHVRVPYTIDLNNTPVTNFHASGLIIHVEEPLTGYGFYAEFNSNAFGDIAKKHGLTELYFADIEIFDVLGIWHHEKIHLYGK